MNLLNARRTTMAGIGVAVAGLAVMATLSTSAASFGGRPLSADLNGAAEVPGPGDPDGTGLAEIRVRAASARSATSSPSRTSLRRRGPQSTSHRPAPSVRTSFTSFPPARARDRALHRRSDRREHIGLHVCRPGTGKGHRQAPRPVLRQRAKRGIPAGATAASWVGSQQPSSGLA